MRLTNILLLVVGVLLVLNLVRVSGVHAASKRVHMHTARPGDSFFVNGDVVGMACMPLMESCVVAAYE
jgi:hypothetical protein